MCPWDDEVLCGADNLHVGLPEDLLAVGVEAEVPETDRGHELLSLLQLTLAAEEGLDELDTGVLAKLRLLARLAGAEHGLLARLEELAELVGQAVAGLDELLDHLLVVLGADLGNRLLGPLDLAGQLDEEQPHVAGHLRDGSGGAVVVDGPVVDPLAERVGVEDTTEEHDGLLRGVPVLERVAHGDSVPLGVGLGRSALGLSRRLGGGRGRLLVVRAGRAGGLGALRDRGRVATSVRDSRLAALGLVARRRHKTPGISAVEIRTALLIVVVISGVPSSVDSVIFAVSLRPRTRGQHQVCDAIDLDELVLVGFPMVIRGPIVGKGAATLVLGTGPRKAGLA